MSSSSVTLPSGEIGAPEPVPENLAGEVHRLPARTLATTEGIILAEDARMLQDKRRARMT
jgi:hypothetical protein